LLCAFGHYHSTQSNKGQKTMNHTISYSPSAMQAKERAMLRALAYREQNDGETRKLMGIITMFAVCFVMAWVLL
jgi:hypothetical protein